LKLTAAVNSKLLVFQMKIIDYISSRVLV